jgi:hypothetical protein
MILLRDLTKAEQAKLYVLKQEILGGFRKRVTPVFKRANGSIDLIEPSGMRPCQREKLRQERMKFVKDARSLVSIEQLRLAPGIPWKTFIDNLYRDVAAGMGLPRSSVSWVPREKIQDKSICQCKRCRIIRRLRGEATDRDLGQTPPAPNLLGGFKISFAGSYGVGKKYIAQQTIDAGRMVIIDEAMP